MKFNKNCENMVSISYHMKYETFKTMLTFEC